MKEKKQIYIFGHLNPDTDSTCSAISYAYLKNILDPLNEYIPSILGKTNEETRFVLDYFNIETPRMIQHLKPQVLDIEFKTLNCVREMDSLKITLETIIGQIGRSIPVVDEHRRLIGIVSISDILPMLLKTHDGKVMNEVRIPVKNIVDILELTKIWGEFKKEFIQGNLYIYNDLTLDDKIELEDVILCNSSEILETDILTLGAGYIIVAEISDPNKLPNIKTSQSIVMTSPKSTYELIQSIIHAFPIGSAVKKDQLEYFTTYETIDDVKNNMLTSKHQRFPVVDEQGYIKGMISKSNLMDVEQKRAILVDHNEKGQSIEGIEDVTIIEVIDHHRVADIQTMAPLYFRVEPVGSTCTIIGKIFYENNIEIPRNIAGLLMSGILSDTLVFKSPTCTQEDKEMATALSKIVGINLYNYGMKMITNGEKVTDKDPEQIIITDMKRFNFGKYKVMISQINTADFEGVYQMYPKIIEAMESKCKSEDLDLAVFLITNIVVGGTELIATGNERWIAENAFNMQKSDESIFLNQTFSRKKQIVPKLMKAAQL